MKRVFPLVFPSFFQILWVPFLPAAPPGSAQIVNSSRIDEDFGHRDAGQIPVPKSPWIESEKAFYRNVLKEYAYDVLVIPFQVQRYAVDAVERALAHTEQNKVKVLDALGAG